MPSIYKIKPEDRTYVEEFRRAPIGPHSPGLQRILNVFRGEALEGKYFLLCVEPFRQWLLAQARGTRGAPFKLLPHAVYGSREEAEWDVFKRRWKRHTGQTLKDPAGRKAPPPTRASKLKLPRITGYSDRLSARPGETIRFMVSCEGLKSYRADIVRLVCGDANPDGPGFKERAVKTPVSRRYPGRKQSIAIGSYAVVPKAQALDALEGFSVMAMIWPTTPLKGRQGLISWWQREKGFALMLDEAGRLLFELGNGARRRVALRSRAALRAREWHFVGASYDPQSGRLTVVHQTLDDFREREAPEASTRIRRGALFGRAEAPLLLAARLKRIDGDRLLTQDHYNGKLENPRLYGRSLDGAAMTAAFREAPSPLDPDLIAAWDFSQGISSDRVADRSRNRLHGETVNLPARAVTGSSWDGELQDWKADPSQWSAIHFHDDDLYDAGWTPDFALTIPARMGSGLYAARLRSGGHEECIPFAVGPRPGHEARIAFLLSTATYMAYANEHVAMDYEDTELGCGKLSVLHPQDVFLNGHREYGLSLYDEHSDGSGVCYSSRLRPMLNMRPKYEAVYGAYGGSQVWGFNADTHIIDWLESTGRRYDVITDEELHERGHDLLRPYRVVITGSHPEYHSRPMLDALRRYTRGGGRLMYLGGNGFYWRIAFHPEKPGVIEVRRAEGGVRAWAAEPGQYYHSFDGAYGGLWRNQGRPPNRLAGVGFCAQGGDLSSSYRRLPDSFKPKVAFVFEGVGRDERIGNFGLVGGGAAGLEIDCVSQKLGTPANTYLLASSENHTDNYRLALEEVLQPGPGQGGAEHPKVRADMAFVETGLGGAVFSVGSIAWAGSLSHNRYRNNVAGITGNVLGRFLNPKPF